MATLTRRSTCAWNSGSLPNLREPAESSACRQSEQTVHKQNSQTGEFKTRWSFAIEYGTRSNRQGCNIQGTVAHLFQGHWEGIGHCGEHRNESCDDSALCVILMVFGPRRRIFFEKKQWTYIADQVLSEHRIRAEDARIREELSWQNETCCKGRMSCAFDSQYE